MSNDTPLPRPPVILLVKAEVLPMALEARERPPRERPEGNEEK